MKKYITSIFTISFVLIFSFISGKDYLHFYEINKQEKDIKIDIEQNISDFSLRNISDLENIDLFHTPDKAVLDNIVSFINSAKNRVYVEVYMLTETRIKTALIKAKKAGLDVKVVLEKNPYNAYNINNKTYDLLEKNNIEVIWSDTKDYSLNHSKFMVIDDEIILSSGNLTYSTFAYNRDFFLFIKDKNLLEKILFIFKNDFIGNKTSIYDENLVLSPDYSRVKLETIISEAKVSLDIYFQYLKDENMFDLLVGKAKSGVKINLILANESAQDNEKEISILRTLGVKVNLIKKPKIHAKAILVDSDFLFIGSENFSTYSLDKNREIGLITKDKKSIEKFIDIFKKDISR